VQQKPKWTAFDCKRQIMNEGLSSSGGQTKGPFFTALQNQAWTAFWRGFVREYNTSEMPVIPLRLIIQSRAVTANSLCSKFKFWLASLA
jgi:hypothetical protein